MKSIKSLAKLCLKDISKQRVSIIDAVCIIAAMALCTCVLSYVLNGGG